MDAAGARHLALRIEQQQHWRQAVAVLDGRQPSRDPDVEHLVDCDDGLRRYEPARGRPFEKRLVDGFWI